jgi:hypothetical protein
MQRLSPRGKRLPNPASRVVSLRVSLVARKICTSLPTITTKMVARAVSMVRFLSRELLVCLHAVRTRHSSIRPCLANLHVTSLGHGYSSHIHVDHSRKLPAPLVKTYFHRLHSYEHVSRYYRIFIRQAFPRDHPTARQFI